MASFANPTSIYIDLVPGYKNLSACAEIPVSTMVRNMWNGCGDDSRLTSFSCFCTDSYSKFSWDISTAVLAGCGPESSSASAQARSAVGVFHDYCRDGTTQLLLTTTTSVAAAASSTSAGQTASTALGLPTTSVQNITTPGPTEAATASAAIHNCDNESRSWLLLLTLGIVVLRILVLEQL